MRGHHRQSEGRLSEPRPLAGAGEAGGDAEAIHADLLGRRRYLPGIRSQDWGRRSFAERCALNTPIQGTAADILKLALSRLIAGLPGRPWLRPLLQIHDELVFEVPRERLQEAVTYIQTCMDAQPLPGNGRAHRGRGRLWAGLRAHDGLE